jgi:hypothetical protein
MDHYLNLNAFFPNGETSLVLLQWKIAKSSSLGMMFQKAFKKNYGDSSKTITFSHLSKNDLAKMLRLKLVQTCSQQILCAKGSITAELVWVYHTKLIEHIHTTTYHSRRHHLQQQDQRAE